MQAVRKMFGIATLVSFIALSDASLHRVAVSSDDEETAAKGLVRTQRQRS